MENILIPVDNKEEVLIETDEDCPNISFDLIENARFMGVKIYRAMKAIRDNKMVSAAHYCEKYYIDFSLLIDTYHTYFKHKPLSLESCLAAYVRQETRRAYVGGYVHGMV